MSADNSTKMPAGIGHAYSFQVFNTISFSIVLGMPMILFFKDLGASATVLGIVMALPPLLNTLQLPAAALVERVGYRAFVLRGWALRSVVILGMAGVAWLPGRVEPLTRVALMLFLLFVYNASRGFSSAGFLPWLTQLVPAELRGRYLSRDQMCTALAMLGSMAVTALFVRQTAGAAAFGGMFAGSFVAGMVSLYFLARIPDVPVAAANRSTGPVPWKDLALHPPFFRLLMFDVAMLVALSGGGVAWVPLMRDRYGFVDWQFLGMMAVWAGVSAVALAGFGPVADRVGSKPLLGAGGLVMGVHFCLWGALAAGVVAPTLPVIGLVQVTAAVGLALFSLPNMRLVMAVVPEMGRSHFFALFSVVTSLTAGVCPILWGLVVDSLAGWRVQWGAWEWNQYSVVYVGVLVALGVTAVCHARLVEPKALTTEAFLHELLVKTPSRAVSRLITRKPLG